MRRGELKFDSQDRERMSEFLRIAVERFEQQIADRFSRDIEIGERIEGSSRDVIKELVVEIIRDFIDKENIETNEGRIIFNQELSRRLREKINSGLIDPELFYGEQDKRIFTSPEAFSFNIYDYLLDLRRRLEITALSESLTPEQKQKLDDYLKRILNIDIQLGRLTSSIRTKLPDAGKRGTSDYTLSYIERLCLRLENIPILNKLINLMTVGLASGILSKEALIRLGGRGLAAAAGATVLGSLGYLSFPIVIGSVLTGVFILLIIEIKQDFNKMLVG